MNLPKKSVEYELWIKVVCPHCMKLGDFDKKKAKRVLITLPLRGLPRTVQCYNCEGTVLVEDLVKTGKEVFERGNR